MSVGGWPHAGSPFHPGERAMQERLGVRDAIERQGRQIVRTWMPSQHREFYAALPWLLIASADGTGRPWCSVLSGHPGFLSSPDPTQLRVSRRPEPGDPLSGNLSVGSRIGLLGIDPASRRRNRLNGKVSELDGSGFTVTVDQAFGNCPQYIQARTWTRQPVSPGSGTAKRLDRLDDEAVALIEKTDTFFVATCADAKTDDPATAGADASHRGGRPGFLRVEGDRRTIVVPDFSGNRHFNTLGNLLLDPRAGLLFPDFTSGVLLLLTGTAEIVWEGPALRAFRGAERLWRFEVDEGIRLVGMHKLDWTPAEPSLNLATTGTWAEADGVLAAERSRDTWRPFRVREVVKESETVRSLKLVAGDGGALPSWRAGQAMPFRITPPCVPLPLIRMYTVSSAPADPELRISVKREAREGSANTPGQASGYLHDHIRVGDTIEALAPRGGFTFDAGIDRPAVLLSAGIGVTPMVAMLRHAVAEGNRTGRFRPTFFFHVARNGNERAFFQEVLSVAATAPEHAVRLHFALTRPGPRDLPGRDYQSAGRIDTALLQRLLPFGGYEFYLCGPPGFVQDLYAGLRELDVSDDLIHAEAFGPATIMRQPSVRSAQADTTKRDPASTPVVVEFRTSGRSATWRPGDGTLLAFAERAGLRPAYGCRAGLCGACVVPIIAGSVAYANTPAATVAAGQAVLCCALPAAEGNGPLALAI